MPTFQQRLNRFFKTPKSRKSHDIFMGGSLFRELSKGSEWPGNIKGMAFDQMAIDELLKKNPGREKIFRKYIGNFDEIIKRGTGVSLYPFNEPINYGKISEWASGAARRGTMRHETFHRAFGLHASKKYQGYANQHVRNNVLEKIFGKELSKKIYESPGGMEVKKLYNVFNFEEYVAGHFNKPGVVKWNLEKNPVFSEALEKIKSDPVMGGWIDKSGRRFSYFKMKAYLGEPTGAKAVSTIMKKHVRSGNKTNGLVNNVLHNKKVNHTIASVAKKVAHLFKR